MLERNEQLRVALVWHYHFQLAGICFWAQELTQSNNILV
jgi:hypothetical protein